MDKNEWITNGDYTVEELTAIAKWAEKLELFMVMAAAANKILELTKGQLTSDLRNVFSVAEKNLVSVRRTSCKMLMNTMNQPLSEEKMAITKEVLSTVCAELVDICVDVLVSSLKCLIFLKNKIEILLPNATTDDEAVFYLKMKGDYYRYQAEIAQGVELEKAISDADKCYADANERAQLLPPTHPVRLGLGLNYSVFVFEIKGDPKMACEYAKKAFDDAIADLDTLQEESYKDSTLIMQLLRDNLTVSLHFYKY